MAMTTPDDPSDAVPLYARIQKILQDRIGDGSYPIGSLIPTEAELAKEFDTSRFTIREALRNLTDLGIVERRQGVGTRVVSTVAHSSYVQSFTSLQELFQVAVETYFVLHDVQRIILNAEQAEIAGGEAGEDWFLLEGVRWTEPGGKPICYIQCYIPARFAEVIPTLQDHQGPFFAVLEQASGDTIQEVMQQIRAVKMLPKMERALGLKPDAIALQLLRRYSTERGVLISSVNWHPSDQMKYVMRINRRTQSSE